MYFPHISLLIYHCSKPALCKHTEHLSRDAADGKKKKKCSESFPAAPVPGIVCLLLGYCLSRSDVLRSLFGSIITLVERLSGFVISVGFSMTLLCSTKTTKKEMHNFLTFLHLIVKKERK